jgi:hypothetical protein
MAPLLTLLICAVTAALAWRKGYHPALWFFSGGIIGLIVLAFLPYVNDKSKLPEEERAAKLKSGNTIGGVISAIGIGFAVLRALA